MGEIDKRDCNENISGIYALSDSTKLRIAVDHGLRKIHKQFIKFLEEQAKRGNYTFEREFMFGALEVNFKDGSSLNITTTSGSELIKLKLQALERRTQGSDIVCERSLKMMLSESRIFKGTGYDFIDERDLLGGEKFELEREIRGLESQKRNERKEVKLKKLKEKKKVLEGLSTPSEDRKVKLYNVFGLDTGLTMERPCAAQKLFAYLGQRQRQELSQDSKPKTIVGPILMYESWCRSPFPFNKPNVGASEKEITKYNSNRSNRRYHSDAQPVNSCGICKKVLSKLLSANDEESINRAISWGVYKFSKNS